VLKICNASAERLFTALKYYSQTKCDRRNRNKRTWSSTTSKLKSKPLCILDMVTSHEDTDWFRGQKIP
jgi:hypothetical protein